ncbi:MAG TPA: glycosyltransferase 87 family protein [Vicinamibacteria bacterium]
MVVPACLLLVARELLLFDPLRVLAWRLAHEPRLAAAVPPWLAPLLPRLPETVDRDPFALLLGALATTLALAYLVQALRGGRRAALVPAAALVLVVAPTSAFVGMGAAMDRPYGYDGGVVQLPLALDRVAAGETPYGADYSRSVLGRQARRSEFWSSYGENPVLRHHLYLPGTHLLMMPGYLLARAFGTAFDPRTVTLAAWALAAAVAARLAPARAVAAAALVLLNPLVYWHQVFGATDMLPVAVLLSAVLAAERGRPILAGALLGLALSVKQIVWPYAPFLLVYLGGARDLRELADGAFWRRLARPLAAAAAVLAVVVTPLALLDARAFWADAVGFMLGRSADRYPFGGTPGIGLANVVLYLGGVASLSDDAPLGLAYLVILPLCALLLRWQTRAGGAGAALAAGSAAFLAALYASRMVHPNFLVPAAVLLPLAFLLGVRRRADVCVAPLLLLLAAVEVAQYGPMRETGRQLLESWTPHRLGGLWTLFGPRAPVLTPDPFGLLWSAVLAGLAVAYLAAGLLGARRRVRFGMAVAAIAAGVAAPTVFVTVAGTATGTARAQHAWGGQALAHDGTVAREAWSESFRRDPPRTFTAERTGVASATVGAAVGDPRLLTLGALVGVVLLVARLVPPPDRPLALAAVLSPATVTGAVFGAPEVALLALLLAAGWAAGAGRGLSAGALAGAAAGVQGHAVAPATAITARATSRLFMAGLTLGWTALWAPGLLAGVRPGWPGVEAGVGLGNLLLYVGWPPTWLPVLSTAVTLGAAVAAWRLASRLPDASTRLLLAAALSLLALWAAPHPSPHALALPLALLALAAAPPDPPALRS